MKQPESMAMNKPFSRLNFVIYIYNIIQDVCETITGRFVQFLPKIASHPLLLHCNANEKNKPFLNGLFFKKGLDYVCDAIEQLKKLTVKWGYRLKEQEGILMTKRTNY